MAGAWKIAYADFVTAMMAFFLLMWILSMASDDTKAGLANFFKPGAKADVNIVSSIGKPDDALIQYAGKYAATQTAQKEAQKYNLAIMRAINEAMDTEGVPSNSSGVSSEEAGVMLNLTPDLMFKPGTMTFTDEGKKVLDQVFAIMQKYNCYLIVRGHADSSENGSPYYPSLWELSAARSNAAVEYLIAKGAPATKIRSVAYGDTAPKVPPTVANAAQINGRVEFNFHRPEVMSTVTNF